MTKGTASTDPQLPSAIRERAEAAVTFPPSVRDDGQEIPMTPESVQRALGRLEGRVDQAFENIRERFEDGTAVMQELSEGQHRIALAQAELVQVQKTQNERMEALAVAGQSARINTQRKYGATIILLLTVIASVMVLRSYNLIGAPRTTATAQAQEAQQPEAR